MQARHLVVVRAGDNSLHDAWLPSAGAPRCWDLVVNYFGNDPERWRRDDVRRIDSKGPKWPALHALLTSGEVDWRAYDHIWLPDDDLACTPDAIERLFTLASEHRLALCQPSLSHDSYISHAITAHNPHFEVRRTNFVELMAPLFTRGMLERVLPTLNENLSGWGLDRLWQAYLDRPRRDCGIVDAVQVRHTRPIGGANYDSLRSMGKSPFQEMAALYRKYFLVDAGHVTWHATLADGRDLGLDDPAAAPVLFGLAMDSLQPRFANNSERDETLKAFMKASAPLRRLAGIPEANDVLPPAQLLAPRPRALSAAA